MTGRPANFVKVVVPVSCEITTVTGISGTSYTVEIESDRRVVWMSADDAFAIINSPLSLAWFAEPANAELRAALKERLKQGGVRPSPFDGMSWSDAIEAMAVSHSRSPFDRAGIAQDALRATGRWR